MGNLERELKYSNRWEKLRNVNGVWKLKIDMKNRWSKESARARRLGCPHRADVAPKIFRDCLKGKIFLPEAVFGLCWQGPSSEANSSIISFPLLSTGSCQITFCFLLLVYIWKLRFCFLICPATVGRASVPRDCTFGNHGDSTRGAAEGEDFAF